LIGYVLCITTMILVELMHDVVSVDAENPWSKHADGWSIPTWSRLMGC
jgi:UDP-glucose 6-dehydrogenase